MPSRPALHHGTSTSPAHSTNSVNDVIAALSRKATASHVDYYKSPSNTPHRPSFSMENILHPHREKNKRNDSKDRTTKEKRLSIVSLRGDSHHKSRDGKGEAKPAPIRAANFDFITESPPICFFGNAANSSGALFSGRVRLHVTDPAGQVTLTKFTIRLRAVITTKRPIQKDCPRCQERFEDDLKEEQVLSEPHTYVKGEDNEFPFSHLMPGLLPATTHSSLGSIDYYLFANATTDAGENIELVHPIRIQRAILPGSDKTSIRIFPPTNLTGRVVLPAVIHPIGVFPIQMSLSGVVEKKHDHELRWRMKKMTWKIEEHTKMLSTACSQHAYKLGEGKAVENRDVKELARDELKGGWKSDFDTAGGEITMEFEAALSNKSNHRGVCDVNSPAGLEVKHNLVIELIVCEEFCPNRNKSLITPTGAARILRMQFNLVVSERAGMGISWDEETPPMYENVPDSPPGYGSADKNDGAFGGAIIEDYHGPELEYVDLERLPAENPTDPPIYRERDLAAVPQSSRPAPRARRRYAGSDEDLPDLSNLSVAGPSAGVDRPTRWTVDELELEPPQYALRRRSEMEQADQEDVGEGSASATPGPA